MSEKIVSISFSEPQYNGDIATINKSITLEDKLITIQIYKKTNYKTYEIDIDKDVLLSMLKQGEGQLIFDNIILNIKNKMQDFD